MHVQAQEETINSSDEVVAPSPAQRQALRKATELDKKGKYAEAEREYRRALSLNPKDAQASLLLGNLHKNNKRDTEAALKYMAAGENAGNKRDKHNTMHNLGNVFYEQKEYDKAIEAYKESLRKDPTDEETRYNLALAKKKKAEGGGGGGEDDQETPAEDDPNGEGNDEGENKQKNPNQGEGGGEQEQKSPTEPADQGQNNTDQQETPTEQVPGQISPEQAQQLLDALEKKEANVLKRLQKQKQSQTKKTEKDW